jgi:hypothetical protein
VAKTGRRRNTILKSVPGETATSSVLKGFYSLPGGQIRRQTLRDNGSFYMVIAIWSNSSIYGMVFKHGKSFERPQGVATGGKPARTAAKQDKNA